jgi:asparagine synthase (glutamine-hydrolysing)
MCGICGHTSDPGLRRVERMNAAMRLRGPDDEGTYVDDRTGVAIGARRLSIIDVAGGHQPVSNEDGTIWAALNGEIYNHPELQERLRGQGHRMASGVDTEVLVHLYEQSGIRMVQEIEGMYAFALWDARREELLVVRDRFGEKPLFYAQQGGQLVFASELDALLQGLDGGLDLDPAAVDAFFVFGYVPGPASIARGIRQLPPGHLLRWSTRSRRVDVEAYWRPAPRPPAARTPRFEELVEETEALLEASVRSRLVSDVPLGVFLSGGIDSTLVAALAARVSEHRIKTFTVGYDVGSVSEAPEARRTAAELGAEHHELTLTQQELTKRIPGLLAGLDQPLADQALVSLHAIAERARADVTVALGGEGADELFGGYPRYRWLRRAERLGDVVPAPAAAKLAGVTCKLPHARAELVADLIRPRDLLARHLDWVTSRRRGWRSRLYGPGLAGRVAGDQLVDGLRDRLNGAGNASVMRRLMTLDQLQWLPDDVLAKADRAGMRVSMEIRTAYLNRELAEFAAGVPAERHAGRTGKALLRALLARIAPHADRPRPKTAFRVPAAEWLRGPLAPLIEHQTASGAAYTEGWFDGKETRRVLRDHQRGVTDAAEVLWPMLAFGLWLDRMRGTAAL